MSDDKHFLCSHLVTLHRDAVHRNAPQSSANMEKIWARGATFNAEEPEEMGSLLRVSCPEWEVSGIVSKCQAVDDGFLIDLAFEAGYEWNAADFAPSHLTDLDVLLVRKFLRELSSSE